MTRRKERGSSAVQVAALALPVAMMILLAVAVGRAGKAQVTVGDAAFDAARAASIARTPSQAEADAATAAGNVLAQQGLHCATLSTSVDTAGFAAAPGTPATVAVTVTCRVDPAALGIPGVTSSKTYTATARSPIDTYRER